MNISSFLGIKQLVAADFKDLILEGSQMLEQKKY